MTLVPGLAPGRQHQLLASLALGVIDRAELGAFSSTITDGQYLPLAPNASASVPFSVNLTEKALTPALGLMVVTQDNKNGKDEANLVKIEVKP